MRSSFQNLCWLDKQAITCVWGGVVLGSRQQCHRWAWGWVAEARCQGRMPGSKLACCVSLLIWHSGWIELWEHRPVATSGLAQRAFLDGRCDCIFVKNHDTPVHAKCELCWFLNLLFHADRSFICYLTPRMPTKTGQDQARAGSPGCHLAFPPGWQASKHLQHRLLLQVLCARKLESDVELGLNARHSNVRASTVVSLPLCQVPVTFWLK